MRDQQTSVWHMSDRHNIHEYVSHIAGFPGKLIQLLEETQNILTVELLDLADGDKRVYMEVRGRCYDGPASIRMYLYREQLNLDDKTRLMRALRAISPEGAGPAYEIRVEIAKKLDAVPYL